MSESVIPEAIAELRRKFEEEAEIHRKSGERMAQYSAAITVLSGLETPIEPVKFEGTLADACRTVLQTTMKPMSPMDVRDGIVALGYDLSDKSNPMASIHSVLKRLDESRNVQKLTTKTRDGDTVTMYQWTGRASAERVINRVHNFSYSGLANMVPNYANSTAQLADLVKNSTFAKELATLQSGALEAHKVMRAFGELKPAHQEEFERLGKAADKYASLFGITKSLPDDHKK
jgi:hypothetical protein